MKGAFLGFIRHLGDKERALEMGREAASTTKPTWDPVLPKCIRAVLEEYDDVFPQDLPQGLPPVRQGHEFHIHLEDDVPPIH